MKNSIAFIIIFISTIALSLVLPWWIIAPMALAYTYFTKLSSWVGFLIPFASVFLAWFLSIHFIDTGIVAELMSKLFNINESLTPVLASFLGGLVAGIFGWSGALIAPKAL
jgi:hypothetical protein